MNHKIIMHRYKPFKCQSKRNHVKVISFVLLKVWEHNFHTGMTLTELAGVLEGFTTYGSIRVLAGRWRKWKYLRRSTLDYRILYSLSEDGRRYMQRHIDAIRPSMEGLKNRIIVYREAHPDVD